MDRTPLPTAFVILLFAKISRFQEMHSSTITVFLFYFLLRNF